jgi:hypothetical protein
MADKLFISQKKPCSLSFNSIVHIHEHNEQKYISVKVCKGAYGHKNKMEDIRGHIVLLGN